MGKCSFLKAGDVRSLAQNNLLLWTEICGIQRAILEASSLCGKPYGGDLETIINDGTPMTWVSGIASVTVTNGGAGYAPVVATATLTRPIGGGVGVVVPDVTAGVITGFTILNNGTSGYEPAVTTLSVTTAGGANADLDPVIIDGVIVDVNILNAGTGYLVGEAITASNPAGTGSGFAATVATIGGSGEITSVTIASNGSDYETVFSTITINHPSGTGFEGAVQTDVGGAITGISIQDGGTGYFPLLPTAYILDNEATGAGAVLEITEADIIGGEIQAINIVNPGFGYSQDVDVIIDAAPTSAGANATAEATTTLDLMGYGPLSPIYYEVLSGQTSNRVIQSQIEFVKDYFTALGYNIRPQVNPNTGYTMQWWILW